MKEQEKKTEQNPPTPLHRGAFPKIAILHDAFLYRGGGERLVTLMAKSLDADLVSGFFSEGSFDPRELGFEGEMISLGKPIFMKGLRHEVLHHRFVSRTRFLEEYDTVIFSGNCLEAVKNVKPSTKKVYYCHTPPRYIYDLRAEYLAHMPKWLHPWLHRYLDAKARRYERLLAEMDIIITNSKNVQKRLRDFTGYESDIVYPPTDTSLFTPAKNKVSEENNPKIGDAYFLSFARLSPPKRVDTIVDTFLALPEERLILTYGKNDPMKQEILEKIKNAPHIEAIESPSDERLIGLICGATATLYIPVDEDFGMSPVESMACGTPVIGVSEGGLLETIVPGNTGKLIAISTPESGITHLREVVQNTPKEEWKNMHTDCIERSQIFSLDAFEKKLKSLLNL